MFKKYNEVIGRRQMRYLKDGSSTTANKKGRRSETV